MKIVIFDMDGTLVDSQQDITISVNYVRKMQYDLAPLTSEYVVKIINQPVRNLAKLFYNTEVYEEEARALFEEHYNAQCISSVYLYEGVLSMLLSLKEQGYKLSIATNAPTPFASKIMQHLDIAKHFDYIIGADVVSNSKPYPDMLALILAEYGFDGTLHKAWMVGDSANDMLAAKRANIEAIFATWGFAQESDEDKILQNPEDIFSILK